MVVNQRVDSPFVLFQTNSGLRRIFNHAFRVFIGGVSLQPQRDVQRIFLAIFENDEIVTIDKIGAAAH
ncbi:Uncharacterised protein [Salmonella enterica subsp. enterica serovar Bovismorbificans]|uniref:Uncharacterized protein n=1 Tax=Salmonella enterica subsp. enterica serovar Bovismorbificans TaxID=58097 RepID=A0A655EGX8_SALET|nr:Uncharacterised protein [Salmonella enterica subsp. enterica serovar Bovismorbificans]